MSAKPEQLEQELKGERLDEVLCACCGKAGVDDIKLKDCDGGCDLVKYCSDECRENHREHHEEACKKRRAELRDKDLFTQPNSCHLGECPICCLPQPIDTGQYALMSCCSQLICNGCAFANQKREIAAGLERRCAFCREPVVNGSKEESDKRTMERVKKNDPVALTEMGHKHKCEGDFRKAFEYFTKAAELDHVDAHASLGTLYLKGEGVEKDDKKLNYHLEQAAIGGHPQARYNLALYEAKNGRLERAKKHWIIAANLGDHVSLEDIKQFYVRGLVSKEEYAAALRGYQAAINEMKSAERDEAEAFLKFTSSLHI